MINPTKPALAQNNPNFIAGKLSPNFLLKLLRETSTQCLVTAIIFSISPVASISTLNLVLACAILQPIRLLTNMLLDKAFNISKPLSDYASPTGLLMMIAVNRLDPITTCNLVLAVAIIAQPIAYLTLLLLEKTFPAKNEFTCRAKNV